ncbi:MAG TPA: DUF2066 domain-containing protein [Alphaproteobacteria bacterium]|nr:DUF2066 domain-containing protein [Alphaproteobacteria bacterium]
MRTVFYAVFVLFFMVFPAQAQTIETAPMGTPAAAAPSYTVEDIEVDVTADNAVQAREKAFEEAQIKGYRMLAERFLSAEDMANFEDPDINTVSALVKDYEVTNEKLSATRYKGIYKIRYSKKAFGNNAPDMGMTHGAMVPAGGDILVLPFYQLGQRTFLWQINPFLEAWTRAKNDNHAGKAVVPVGDIDDISQIRDDQALTYDPSKLNAMRLRYHARDVALMIARPQSTPGSSTNVEVSFYKVKPYGPEMIRQMTVQGYPGELEQQLYNRVVAQAAMVIESGARGQQPQAGQAVPNNNQVQQAPLSGPVSSITAQVNFNTVREWVDAKRSIERAYGVQSVEVKSLSARHAMVGVNFQGSVDALRQSLQQVGIGSKELPVQLGSPVMYQFYTQRAAPRPY